MGGGSTVRQHERRFFQGEPEETGRKEECEEAYWSVKTFGEYEVHKTEVGEYELIKMGIIARALTLSLTGYVSGKLFEGSDDVELLGG
jgi:hypothetical protein